MGAVASMLRRAADAISQPEEVMVKPPGLHWTDDDEARDARGRMARAILDDETLGVVVLMVRDMGTHTEVVIGGEVHDELWPSIAMTLSLLEREARRV